MNLETYNTAHDAAVWRELSHFGRFVFSGKEAAALLHHLTTNDIRALKDGSTCDTALITSKARVLDLLTVSRIGNELHVVTSPNRREAFIPHCERFIVYRQDVHISDVTSATSMVGLFGPQWQATLATMMGAPEIELKEGTTQEIKVDGVPALALLTRRLPGGGCLLWSASRGLTERFAARTELPRVDDATYNVLRVESAIPAAGLELTEDINPWEAGFDYAISLHKGCYNGQEVVARLNTYKKVKQHLFRLKIEKPFPLGERPLLTQNGKTAGIATSSAISPKLGPLALAYIRGDYETPGEQLEMATQEGLQRVTIDAGYKMQDAG